jgi:hypothetical protein
MRALIAAAILVSMIASVRLAAAQPAPLPSSTPQDAASAAPRTDANQVLPVVGQVLTIANGYLVFTTGDAVKLDPALKVPSNLRIGETVRVRIDPIARTIVAIELDPRKLEPTDVEAGKIPRGLVSASPKSTRSSAFAEGEVGLAAHAVTVTINVRVPDSTPATDDVYLATDRTNFAPAEVRMTRVDARSFTTAIQLPSGTQLRYDFSRGNFANIERDRLGGIVTPRTLKAQDGLQTHDTVSQWADIN